MKGGKVDDISQNPSPETFFFPNLSILFILFYFSIEV